MDIIPGPFFFGATLMFGTRKIGLVRQAPISSQTTTAQTTEVKPVSSQSDADPIAAAMQVASADVPKLLTPQTLAEMLGITERTLERWRIIGEGPRYVKLSRSTVRYMAEDVAAFVTARLRANTAQ